jgi:hypothetical protein
MRYIRLAYCDGSGELYQIHDDIGGFVRFANLHGDTIDAAAKPFEASVVDADASPPSWAPDFDSSPAYAKDARNVD